MRLLATLGCTLLLSGADPNSRQATGVKVGEVTENSAIVWMRLTAKAERNSGGTKYSKKGGKARPVPAGVDVNSLEGAAPGAAGKVRVRYAATEDLRGASATPWTSVRVDNDYTQQFRLTGLKPATTYYYAAETEGHSPLRGRFKTAPLPDAAADATFTVITGQMYADLDDPAGFLAYDAMRKLKPDFIVPTGDNVYYDNEEPKATTAAVARYHWQRMYSMPRLIAFYLEVPTYFEKDDHDTLRDDCWPTMNPPEMLPLTFEEGRRIFLEQVPMGDKTWRTFRWGKDLQVWLPEGRDFRSPNRMPDGPGKTIWGAAQKKWLKDTIAASKATYRVMVSPTPLVGPDRKGKGDNHANAAFATEGNEFRQWVKAQGLKNFYVACGDRHWQYHSVHPDTGLDEFSCGPISDEHAGGSPGEDPRYHRFHRVQGGFLSVNVRGGKIAFRHHDVKGAVVYEYSPKQ